MAALIPALIKLLISSRRRGGGGGGGGGAPKKTDRDYMRLKILQTMNADAADATENPKLPTDNPFAEETKRSTEATKKLTGGA